MRTKEFIEKANELGYNVKKVGLGTKVSGEINCCTVALINEDFDNMVDLSYVHHMSDDLFDAIVAYAKTPISERKDIIRKRVKVVSTDENSYLHIDYLSWGQKAYLRSLSDQSLTNVITDFSPEQIEQLKSRNDIAIDWKKVTLEEVD